MAYQRQQNASTPPTEGLDSFVNNTLTMYSNQVAVRDAADETNFNRLVLEQNLSLSDQLDYRKQQLARSGDSDVATKTRIKKEISSLTDRIEQKQFSDAYTQQLIGLNSGMSSVDSILGWLRDRRVATTDETIQGSIDNQIAQMEDKKFTIQQQTIANQTKYAQQDKTGTLLADAVATVTAAKNKALLSGQTDVATSYDLQLQSLQQAVRENDVDKTLKGLASATLTGASTAIGLLDSYNSKIASAADNGPLTINGTTYNSPKDFWTQTRGNYLSDQGGNGFFARLADEQKTDLKTKYSSNVLNNNDITAASSVYNTLGSRTELQPFVAQLNATKQDVVQTGADYQAKSVVNNYSLDYDVNSAVNKLNQLKSLGANIDDSLVTVLKKAGDIKFDQVNNILNATQDYMKNNPGATAEQAINASVAAGAGQTISPNQAVSKTEEQIAKETAAGSAASAFKSDPRTTVNNTASTPQTASPAPIVPTTNDLSSKYGIVGKTVYDKSTGRAFQNEQEFFNASGLNSFQNVKFDTAYQPPAPVTPTVAPAPTPTAPTAPTATPAATTAPKTTTTSTPAQSTYKVVSGDTLSALAQKYLGDAKRYTEIAKLNNIADPNKISVGQSLILPTK